jgi:regulator of nucleoside diphosphate kinase
MSNVEFVEAGECFRFRGEDVELPPIHILAEDYEVLADIVCRSAAATPGIELLWRELQRAVVLSTDHPPSGLIHLNSTVRYTDLVDPRRRTVQLVRPSLSTRLPDGLSVASPVGAALIGLRAGDRFSWLCVDEGLRMLRVDRVQPDPGGAARLQAIQAAERRRRIDELLSAR